jgi:hypothetical protein
MTLTNRQEEILREIHRVVDAVKPQSLTQQLFKRHGQISVATVYNNFGSWNKAVEAAGLTSNPKSIRVSGYKSIDEGELFKAIGELWQKNGRRPTQSMMMAERRFSMKPYAKRWGTFTKALDEYVRRFGEPQIRAIQPKQEEKSEPLPKNQPIRPAILPQTHKPTSAVTKKVQVFGEPLDFRGIRYAPVNEQGVVYLFGMISRELGFLIESIRTDFPDCEGKRVIDKAGTKWQHIRIEFEYRSSNFREHGHNPENCDLIVCWIHDWSESPLEVLELKSNITRLRNK